MLATVTRRLMRWSLRSLETSELALEAARRFGPRHASDLATTLVAVARHRAAAGSTDAALDALAEAVAIYRRAPSPGLARALHLRMVVLCSVDRADEALADADEAMALFSRCSDMLLADFLRTYGACLARCGRLSEAVPVASRAVVLRRRLVALAPAAQQQELGDALTNLSALLVRLGRHAHAAQIATEAVLVWRRLVTVRTEPILAVALLHLGASLAPARPADGLRAADEAISLLQGRLDDAPGRHEENLLRARLVRNDCLARLELPAEIVLGPYPLCDKCRSANGVVAMRSRQVHVRAHGHESCVDVRLAGIMRRLWAVCETTGCGEDEDGRSFVIPAFGQSGSARRVLVGLGLEVTAERGVLFFRLPPSC
ncbi:MAG: tetratricopeptide repeat protein [Actinophytocola sp.]|uniref:tetratricopeptide repeat protein n=1 Tax=Actinophytocola sp. TaxID=1872138 RepID=UPI0013247337|nr:tetratricopeptide repeat protein [Actinophytocola sp.]MPZ83159.1 tetratricopeptide repeat protein [Actinophytocola sp.]